MAEIIQTTNDHVTLRFAEKKDVPTILSFIKELASYEKMLHLVTADENILMTSLFEIKTAEVIMAEYDEKPVGFMLFFHNFSTFLGKAGIYLEDLYIIKEMRHQGIGNIMLSYLAKVAVDRDCHRLEWACLDWNEPSISFYKSLQAEAMSDWTGYRLTGDSLHRLASQHK